MSDEVNSTPRSGTPIPPASKSETSATSTSRSATPKTSSKATELKAQIDVLNLAIKQLCDTCLLKGDFERKCVSKEEFLKLQQDLDIQFANIKNLLNNNDAVQYDEDHDVIMGNTMLNPVMHVPEPGTFAGALDETELFCELCYSTFKYPPNSLISEENKINFVQTRLRGPARTWYQSKYANHSPHNLIELLEEIGRAFPTILNKKLSQIQLLQLKQEYGKVENYIEKFRNLTRNLHLNEEALVLLFLNGLHRRYQEEIEKNDQLPNTLEDIITKCLLFEGTLKLNNKIRNNKPKSKNSNNNFKNNNKIYYHKNKNYNNNYNKNNNNNYNNNNNNNNNYGNNVIKTQKISSKN